MIAVTHESTLEDLRHCDFGYKPPYVARIGPDDQAYEYARRHPEVAPAGMSKRRVASGGSRISDRPETAVDLVAALRSTLPHGLRRTPHQRCPERFHACCCPIFYAAMQAN
jgi:hypothetical protein